MTQTLRVALIGFSTFERTTLDAFFRLAARRKPSYERSAMPEQADVVLVDSDNAAAVAEARPWVARSVSIGAHGTLGQLGQMPRPINMMALLKLLDALLAGRPAAPVAVAAPVVHIAPIERPAAPRMVERPVAVPAVVESPSSEPPSSRFDHILVVDDSDIALRFMAHCLGRFGFEVHLVKSGEEALQRVSEQHFEFVFMDVTMPGIDGYQTCKLIKKRPYPSDRRAPRVVMLTSRGGMVDKMRGTLAGCDGYLTKPLQQDALLKIIGDHIVEQPAEATTQRVPIAQH
jgi:two-component system, cell cycle response regulator